MDQLIEMLLALPMGIAKRYSGSTEAHKTLDPKTQKVVGVYAIECLNTPEPAKGSLVLSIPSKVVKSEILTVADILDHKGKMNLWVVDKVEPIVFSGVTIGYWIIPVKIETETVGRYAEALELAKTQTK